MRWSTACPDWERRIVARESLIPFAPLFPDMAADALAVFKSLRIPDVIGNPTFGEASEPFVFDFVAAIFGALNPETMHREIQEFFVLISKKNAKSTIAAGIMITALIVNPRPDQELVIIAPSIEAANNTFGPASSMVRLNPALSERLHIITHRRMIKHLVTNAELKVVSDDANVVAGSKAGFVLFEELWQQGKNPRAQAMFVEAEGGLSVRPEGFIITLTTHSDEPPSGVFKEKLEYARDVRDGRIDDRKFLPVLYEWPAAMIESEAYLDPENFYVTNPNIGRSVSKDFIKKKIDQASAGEGESLQLVLAKHLNLEIGLRMRRNRWRGADHWQGAAEPGLDLDALIARCEVLVVGIDGGGLDDLFGLCVGGREAHTGRWLFWTHAWADRDILLLRPKNATRLLDFEADGDLTLFDTLDQNVDEAIAIISRVLESGKLAESGGVGLDPARVALMVDALNDIGLVDPRICAVFTGSLLSGTVWAMESKLKARAALHGGSRMMDWCVSNAKATPRGAGILIQKATEGDAKIDPLAALFNAAFLLARNPVAMTPKVSPYLERGVRVI